MTLTSTEHKYVQLDERGIPIIAGTTVNNPTPLQGGACKEQTLRV